MLAMCRMCRSGACSCTGQLSNGHAITGSGLGRYAERGQPPGSGGVGAGLLVSSSDLSGIDQISSNLSRTFCNLFFPPFGNRYRFVGVNKMI
jgi:hypothetical protein